MDKDEVKQTVGDGVFQKLLEDSLEDRRKDGKLKGKVIFWQWIIILALIGVVLWVVIYSQNLIHQVEKESQERMYNFLSEYDFETEIELNTNHIINSDTSGNIFLAR